MKRSLLFLSISTALLVSCNQAQKQDTTLTQDSDDLELIEVDVVSEEAGRQQLNRKVQAPKKELLQEYKNAFPHRSLKSHSQASGYLPSTAPIVSPTEPINRENYNHFEDNPVKLVSETPVSTFSIDVDTGSYTNMRRMLNQGILPPQDSVRAEEFINYFKYNYPTPDSLDVPFSVTTEMGPSPWSQNSHLLHIGLQGYKIDSADRPNANLTFLVDVSGSMNSANKLGLLKSSLKLLSNNLNEKDRVSIVVYAGAAGTVLEPTAGSDVAKISEALNRLTSGGSTNGAAGIELAYQMNEQNFIEGGINRIILATDGDFNVGTVNFETLIDMVERKREKGISLTTLGFGIGNYNDHLMEQLANKGNGNYAYIDTLKEAQKSLVNEMNSTLMTIAKDVKIQIEFNPMQVSQYRLIGYENRQLNREDFNNDKIDAGEIGAGHSVTAIYEVVLTDQKGWIEPLKYQQTKSDSVNSSEIATLKLRYKNPEEDHSRLISQVINKSKLIKDMNATSDNYKFSAAVSGFAQLLRGGHMLNQFSYNDVIKLSQSTQSKDTFGYRGEFLQLVDLAKSLQNNQVKN